MDGEKKRNWALKQFLFRLAEKKRVLHACMEGGNGSFEESAHIRFLGAYSVQATQ